MGAASCSTGTTITDTIAGAQNRTLSKSDFSTYWSNLFSEQEAFWGSKDRALKEAHQEPNPNAGLLPRDWLPTFNGTRFTQPALSEEKQLQILRLLDTLDLQRPSVNFSDDVVVIGRTGVAGECPSREQRKAFDPWTDLAVGQLALIQMTVMQTTTLQRGWEVVLVTWVSNVLMDDGSVSEAEKTFDGIYLKPLLKGQTKTTVGPGDRTEDWPEGWWKHQLTEFTTRTVQLRKRNGRVFTANVKGTWDFKDMDVDVVVWADEAAGRKNGPYKIRTKNHITRLPGYQLAQKGIPLEPMKAHRAKNTNI